MVRAIMKCTEAEGDRIKLEATYATDEGKPILQDFSKWTPSGRVEMYVTNPAARAQFEVGKFYSIDFEAVGPGEIPLK
jgi:hypothetical protein